MDQPTLAPARLPASAPQRIGFRAVALAIGLIGGLRVAGLIARWLDQSLGPARWGDDALIVTLAARTSLGQVYAPRPYTAETLTGYINPPHLAQLISPLRLLPVGWDGPTVTWLNMLCVLLLGLTLWEFGRFPVNEAHWRPLLVASGVASPATFAALSNGAFVAIIVVGYGLLTLGHRQAARIGYLAGSRSADMAFAGGVVVLSLKPQHALFPMALLIAMRQWRAVTTAIIGLGSVVGGSILVGGIGPWVEFTRQLKAYSESADAWLEIWRTVAPTRFMPNARGIAFNLFGFGPTNLINLVSTFLLGATLLLCLSQRATRATVHGTDAMTEHATRLWCAGLVLGTFLGQHVNLQDLVWLAWLPLFGVSPATRKLCASIGLAVTATAILDTSGVMPRIPAVSVAMAGLAVWASKELLVHSRFPALNRLRINKSQGALAAHR